MKKKLHTTSAMVFSLALIGGSTSAYAVTLASDDFSSGLSSGGSGWDNNWQVGANGGSSGSVAFDASATPLDSNGDYASIVGSGSNITQGIHRTYTSALSAPSQEHTISFLFRLDTLSATETGDPSRGLVTHGSTTFGLSGSSTWALYVQEGNFFYFDGDGTGSFGGSATNSGVAVTEGDLYSVTINNRIGANTNTINTGGEWDLLVTNLSTGTIALSETNLEFRATSVPSAAIIGLGVAGPNTTSFDQVSVDVVIPEPSSTLLLGLGSFALILRRKK